MDSGRIPGVGRSFDQDGSRCAVRIEPRGRSLLVKIYPGVRDAGNLLQRLLDRDRTKRAGHVLRVKHHGLRRAAKAGVIASAARAVRIGSQRMIHSPFNRTGERATAPPAAPASGCSLPRDDTLAPHGQGVGTRRTGSADLGCKVEVAEREPEKRHRQPDKDRAIGSSAVRLPIHAPPMPGANSTSGPTQHTDAPMVASIAWISR